MTFIEISGIKIVRANGTVYRYHRATGKRIKADPETPLSVSTVPTMSSDVQAHRALLSVISPRRRIGSSGYLGEGVTWGFKV